MHSTYDRSVVRTPAARKQTALVKLHFFQHKTAQFQRFTGNASTSFFPLLN
ncbi:hypothetical protein PJE062_2176 [Pseudovibrio sp. JE062]|nr:hypothetical protein PJE062_2176 [Pseudovibrio sp. JE062]